MKLTKISIVLIILILMISPVIATQYSPPWAHNYDFLYPDGNDTRPCALIAKNNLTSVGYNAFTTTNSGALNSYDIFKDDAIFFFVGHGIAADDGSNGGAILYWNGAQGTIIAAQHIDTPPISHLLP
jgi:hypothetical protein